MICRSWKVALYSVLKALSHSNKLNERMSDGLKQMSDGEIIASIGCPVD